MPADEAKIAIHIAHGDAKNDPDKSVINLADQNAVERIMPLNLPTVHKTDVRPQALQQQRQLARIILPIAIGVEEKVLFCGSESAAQSSTVATVDRMVNDAKQAAIPRFQFIEQ